jgi:transporter family-2 protein
MTTAARTGGGVSALFATPPRALAMTLMAGGAVSLQAFINGRLGKRVGSFELAAAINNTIGLLALAAIVLLSGALPRARARVAEAGSQPVWFFLGGLCGAMLVTVMAAGAPEVGVALLTVALVCGTTAGSLFVDAAGIGPAGHQPITAPRVAGVVLAIGATVVSALGAAADFRPLILALALITGIFSAVQQAANGRLAQITGEPFVAAVVNFAVGLFALAVIAVGSVLIDPPHGSFPPAQLFAGGLCGAFIVAVLAAAVQTVGVLRAGLALVAGQTLGALLIDLVAPVQGRQVTAATVIGTLVMLIAVLVSGRGANNA